MRDLKPISREVKGLISMIKKNKNIIALYIFGSFGTKQQHPSSDIDLAILFQEEPPLFDFLCLEADICKILQRDDVDVINLNSSSIDIQFQVISTGDLLYCSNELLLADFKERVFNIYDDYSYILNRFYNDYKEGLKIKYGN
ncbi:nucleotidyltransferase domain-containing protein [Thermoanaerobacteraceae bacterium SP2]|nr:nucleotidyltransferase domain-containing protein [Thermoanaerobacteraceae bacterium SP2]